MVACVALEDAQYVIALVDEAGMRFELIDAPLTKPQVLREGTPVVDGAPCVVTGVYPHNHTVFYAPLDKNGQVPVMRNQRMGDVAGEHALDYRRFEPLFDGTGRFRVLPPKTAPATKAPKRARRKS
jgi:hypothetical protein